MSDNNSIARDGCRSPEESSLFFLTYHTGFCIVEQGDIADDVRKILNTCLGEVVRVPE